MVFTSDSRVIVTYTGAAYGGPFSGTPRIGVFNTTNGQQVGTTHALQDGNSAHIEVGRNGIGAIAVSRTWNSATSKY
jgi:hypothetical protein